MKKNILSKKLESLALTTVKVCLALAWAMFIFAVLEQPMPIVESDAKGFTISDKIVHIFLFGVLLWLILNAWREWSKQMSLLKSGFRGVKDKSVPRLVYILSAVLVFSFAYSCEYLQQFVLTRTSSWLDLSFGVLGIIISVFLYKKMLTKSFSSGVEKGTNKPRLLVHLCCGPCGAQISDDLKKNYEVSLFFTNSNIDTKIEFNKRLKAVETLAKHSQLPLIVESYDHQDWLEFIKDFEDESSFALNSSSSQYKSSDGHNKISKEQRIAMADEPEKGRRCLLCYRYRLAKTAQTAGSQGFDFFTTSLSVSPFKDGQAVIHLGRAEAGDNKVKFLDQHFGLADGFKKSVAKAKELGLYRQKYCGCEFSKR